MPVKTRKTRRVLIGQVALGGGEPVRVQAMVKVPTTDVPRAVAQVEAVARAGAELVRLAVPDRESAAALASVVRASSVPIVADCHFDWRLAFASLDAGAAKVRVNPGNMKEEGIAGFARAAEERGVAVRVGLNEGSVRKQDAPPPELARAMAEMALEWCGRFEDAGLDALVVSLKASTVRETVEASRFFAERSDIPLHIGVTAAGPRSSALIKSAAAVGALLLDGVGETVRVSMTGPPGEEVVAALSILRALGLRKGGIDIMSCPTCGRCKVDLVGLVEEFERRVRDVPKDLRVALMGCVVNGPGEAKGADIGLACDGAGGVIFRGGERLRRVGREEMFEELLKEVLG